MDSFEASRVLYSRIRKLEPENVTNKIIGYLLLKHGEQEMIRFAFGPDHLILNLIHKTKFQLCLGSKTVGSPPISPSVNPIPISTFPLPYTPLSPASSHSFSSPKHPTHNSDFIPLCYSDSTFEDYRLQNMLLEDQLEPLKSGISGYPNDYYYPVFDNMSVRSRLYSEATLGSSLSVRCGPRSLSLSEFPVKTCHYFNKGFCKHGSSCRYFHGQSFPEDFSHMFGLSPFEDQLISPGSLEKLELEITELLKSRGGNPVSIASLPMMYYEKYGKTLQAEGYLTESQRHGKAGYSLTRLLARLKNSIRLIDRPHGQHSVILMEDAPKYMEDRSERNDPGPIVSGSRQIYLTFPAESTFTEEDVTNYFNTFGPVHDVRIPCQQKRMFGFVTFVSADTVKMILSKGNPHYVCGTRVLVKPYREKSKLIDRKYSEKFEPPLYYHSHHMYMDSELHSRPTGWESPRLLRKQLMEEHELALELGRRRLSELQVAQKPQANQSYIDYSMDELKASEVCADHSKFPSAERFNHLLDVLSGGSTSDDNPKHVVGSCSTDQESNQGLDLPESPFAASPMESNVSTAI
ncbi:zinc finger CCCH domain-containing protein 18-like isoform X2 [Cornus florida]|uniref:zinc finger CCCH domain-containing protein 18-like isoform X2 n=1 Tax=Cornus florida TaxID=4283 RepID=UPI00289E2144|nr:zinc finger CCCH domain-containing protein 18-like isoform X2 [Cornus florida]